MPKNYVSFFQQVNCFDSIESDFLRLALTQIRPVSSAEFKQDEFITQIIEDVRSVVKQDQENVFLKGMGKSYQKHSCADKAKLSQVERGLCAGLTHAWFEHLFKPANLIDIIKKGIHESILLRIIELQVVYGELNKQSSMVKESHKTCDKTPYDISSEKGLDYLEKHFEVINKKSWGDVGHLNTMSYVYPKNSIEDSEGEVQYEDTGHVVGWVKQQYQEESGNEATRYILFDANTGEHILRSQQHLIA